MNECDEIAVTDTGNHRVQVFSSDGTNTYDILIEIVTNRETLTRPRGVAFDKNNNIIVVDTLNSLV